MSTSSALRALTDAIMVMLLSAAVALLALVAAHAWNLRRRADNAACRADAAHARAVAALATMRALIDASRDSSASVIATLAEAIRHHEPAVDAVLAFTPSGGDLACIHTSGERVEHFSCLRVPRDAPDALPALAAVAGHRVAGTAGAMMPTDRHALAVPMLDRGHLRAVVYASSSFDRRDIDEEAIVEAVTCAASPFALALEREADRADATYDGLTGLLTPRAFRLRLREAVERARGRPAQVLSLWFVDTDHFKTVNDAYGHASGDLVLQTMAGLLRAHIVGETDVAARNGGDEFCALVVDAQKTSAIERAQAFCEAVRRHAFAVPVAVTASIGVASYPYDAGDAHALLEVADAAMYHSKRCGRDRVSFAVDGASFSTFR